VALLLAFAVLAGAGTAVSPCVLPVLPAVLSAGSTGGRRRPLGVACGLAVTFTAMTAGGATVLGALGLGDGATRAIAVAVLVGFGLAVAVPPVGARLEAALARLTRYAPRRARGDGFASGLLVGGALGFAYAPCAGPILAAVITVGAASGAAVAVGAAYAAGSAAVLLALALGGRAVAARVRAAGRGGRLQVALGAVMVLTGVAVAGDLDVRFQTAIANHLPALVVDPAKRLEDTKALREQLAGLRGDAAAPLPEVPPKPGEPLPVLRRAPEFAGAGRWFNSRPLTMAGLRGRVVLVDFWTYTCINCIRTFPELKAWDAAYRRKGLTIVGVHTPEFAFERDAGNVAAAIRRNHLRYPVVQDNEEATWDAWANQFWPADYLVDARGRVRYVHYGEGAEARTEAAIRSLLREAGRARLGAGARIRSPYHPAAATTPETYLCAARARGIVVPGGVHPGVHDYPPPPATLPLSRFALAGRWRVTDERAEALRGAALAARVAAKDVYLVLSPPPGQAGRLAVAVDGGRARTIRIDRQRLYHLASFARLGTHRLLLRPSPGVAAYAFTFG
jgi:cytochrome c biogenesis protein CcdA/thiol-disulfide isomerase/thioredoxin